MSTPGISDAVRRLFTETFAARDIAEPLASFDVGALAGDVRAFMESRGLDVVGVRREGRPVGYVEKDSLAQGGFGERLRPFDDLMVVSDSAPLLAVLQGLDKAPFVFVAVFGEVGGVVARPDLLKAPARMWLFGIVTLIELRFAELIDTHCPGDAWKEYVSDGRLQKAQALLDERRRRNQSLRLLDCLQFSDKGQIIARNEAIRKLTVFSSRRQAEEAVKSLEQLRNNLAHAQDVVSGDWATVVQLCDFIARQ